MPKTRQCLLNVGFLLLLSTHCLAAEIRSNPSQAPIGVSPTGSSPLHATRWVATFEEKEKTLLEALQKKDRKSLHQLLSKNFELIDMAHLGQSHSEEELISEAALHPRRQLVFNEFSAREMNSVVLVNFQWEESLSQNRVAKATWMVTDAWVLEENEWRLKTRFIAAKSDSKQLPPGVYQSNAPIKKLGAAKER